MRFKISTSRQKLELNATATEALLTMLIRHVPTGVAIFDRQMRYLEASERWCADWGLEYSQILGRSHYEVFPDVPDRWKEIHRRCIGGESISADYDVFERPDLSLRHMRWQVRPWVAGGSLPEGIVIFSEDITYRKEIEQTLRERESMIDTLFETASQGIVGTSEDGRIRLVNNVLKTAAREELLAAVESVVGGRTYLTQGLPRAHPANIPTRPDNPARLSPRERETLQLIAQGKASKEIAGILNISVRTVDFHRENLKRKLKLKTIADLTRHAIELDLA